MATAPALPFVSVDEYFEQNLWKEWEFDNGVLVPRNSGSRDHARMIIHLGKLLEASGVLTAYAGFVLSIPWTSKYRVPDVCCYPAGVDPGNTLEQQPPPLVVFEVLSKTDPIAEMRSKCSEYIRLGIRHIYIVDPAAMVVLVPQGNGFPELDGTSIDFQVGSSAVSISIRDLFAGFPVHSRLTL